jgi:hypothetical protein
MENKTVDLQTMSLIELKALAYDLINQRECIQNNINTLMTEISSRMQQEAKNNIPQKEKV